jgi:hypothetical protein
MASGLLFRLGRRIPDRQLAFSLRDNGKLHNRQNQFQGMGELVWATRIV